MKRQREGERYAITIVIIQNGDVYFAPVVHLGARESRPRYVSAPPSSSSSLLLLLLLLLLLCDSIRRHRLRSTQGWPAAATHIERRQAGSQAGGRQIDTGGRHSRADSESQEGERASERASQRQRSMCRLSRAFCGPLFSLSLSLACSPCIFPSEAMAARRTCARRAAFCAAGRWKERSIS